MGWRFTDNEGARKMIVWIIGLSASGKTTLALEVLEHLRTTGESWMFMDGDRMRTILGEDLGHTVQERRKLGERMVNLSMACDAQGIHLLASILSIFPEQREWLRRNVQDYREIFLDVPLDILTKRDNKGLYEKALAGEMENVVGVDIPFPRPERADLVIDNSADAPNLQALAVRVIKALDLPALRYRYTEEDRIKHREKYFFSSLHGPLFLSAYKKSREKALKNLEQRLERLALDYRPDRPPVPWDRIAGPEPRLPVEFVIAELTDGEVMAEGEAKTVPLLTHWLRQVSERSGELETILPEILRLVQRFEASKRIYGGYERPAMKRTCGGYGRMMHYALFELLLLIIAERLRDRNEHLVFLNAALKAGDILSSCLHRIATPCEIWLCKVALNSEVETVDSLRHEVMA